MCRPFAVLIVAALGTAVWNCCARAWKGSTIALEMWRGWGVVHSSDTLVAIKEITFHREAYMFVPEGLDGM
jgi:hypothetical protein